MLSEEYDQKYERREKKKGRAMIEKMFEYLYSYDGRFEDSKPTSEKRNAFRKFKFSEKTLDDWRNFEDFILDYFDKGDVGFAARNSFTIKEKKNFCFSKMLEMFPKRLDHKKAVEVMKLLRLQHSEAGNSLEDFLNTLCDDEIKSTIEQALTALKY